MSILNEDDVLLAAEYSIGLLSPADHAVAASRIATDRDFANEVITWDARLEPMLCQIEEAPPPHIWQNILAAYPEPSTQDQGKKALRIWQGLTALSATAAAVFAVIAFQPRAQPTALSPTLPLVAALGSETGPSAITARYDIQHGQMLLTPVLLQTGKLYPELWIIPEDGKARSLGMLNVSAPMMVPVSNEMRQFIGAGATLAVTCEPVSGAPGGKATGPIIASGKIITI